MTSDSIYYDTETETTVIDLKWRTVHMVGVVMFYVALCLANELGLVPIYYLMFPPFLGLIVALRHPEIDFAWTFVCFLAFWANGLLAIMNH